MNAPKSAFTLIELLVVITIIAILASMLLPMVKLVQQAAHSSRCQSNLHQLGLASASYASDYDDFLPPGFSLGYGTNWRALMTAYIGSADAAKLLLCPSARLKTGTAHYTAQFAMLPNLNKTAPNRVKQGRMDEARPDGALLFDGNQDSSGNTYYLAENQGEIWGFFNESPTNDRLLASVSPTDDYKTVSFRHRKSASLLYGDMHVAARSATSLTRGELRSRRNGRKWDYEWWVP